MFANMIIGENRTCVRSSLWRRLFVLSFLFGVGISWGNAQALAQVRPTPRQGKVSPSGKFTPKKTPQSQPKKGNISAFPLIRPLGKTKLLIGKITIDKVARTISFPAKVEIREKVLEYVLVHQSGKVHESLLSTKISPRNLHIAVLLLDGVGKHPNIEVTWEKNGPNARVPLSDLICARNGAPKLLPGGWFYNGTTTSMPENYLNNLQKCSFVSLIKDPYALIEHQTATSLLRDDVYYPFTEKLPSSHPFVTLVISFPSKK